ncbi:gamma-glutamylcyclotransferase [Metabacillus sp. RGM 3146]|uniref:gamma-glutamylcyclotransferase n=1 Tax=Metabacillus sp. RGM 3146 TaxID=3401092 RepID=UPI003B9C4820
MNEELQNLFVYGTLRSQMENENFVKNAKTLSRQCFVEGDLFDTGNGYPVLVPGGGNRAYGELIQVSKEELERIDELEGYAGKGKTNDYERMSIVVHTDLGEKEAQTYVFDEDKAQGMDPVTYNDWKCHLYLEKPVLYYFAYGSCMDEKRFIEHSVDHFFKDVLGRGAADGYDLAFTRRAPDGGRADMVETGGLVEGKVYQISQDALKYLYKREGVFGWVYRPAFVDIEINGEELKDVLTFLVIHKENEITPPQSYLDEIICGATGCVSEEYLIRLMELPYHPADQ